MNEREEFLQYFRLVFINIVEQLDTMSESQVLDGLLEVRAARNIWKEELAERFLAERFEEMIQAGPRERLRVASANGDTREQLAHLVSIQAFFTSVNKLRSRAGPNAVPLGSRSFDLLEEALNERLESLRKGLSSDS
jgi:hypothetical protein